MLLTASSWLLEKVSEKGFQAVIANILPTEVEKKFKNCIETVSEKLQKEYPDVLGGSIELFFTEKEIFDELFKLLFKCSKINVEIINEKFDIKTLPDQFICSFIDLLKNELCKDIIFDEIFSNNTLYFSIIEQEKDLKDIIKYTKLSLETLKQLQNQRTFIFSDFFSKYKKNLISNFSEINYIGLGLSRSYNKRNSKLKDIYVRPNFQRELNHEKNAKNSINNENPHESGSENPSISLFNLFDSKKHLVLLGAPGSGKSCLVKYVSNVIFEKKGKEFRNTEVLTRVPFRVELRKYLSYKKNNSCSITRYMASLLEEEYCIPFITEADVIKILDNHQTIIFFDGLDEIFDIEDKIQIRNDIQNFCSQYSNSKIVITSRIIGYDDAPFDEQRFETLKFLNFNENQITEYVKKWYSIEEKRETVKKQEIDNFLSQKNVINQELIENPLLLSLIVIIYRNNLELPRTKLEIYKSCTRTLVDKWDATKKLTMNLKLHDKKDSIFADLAFWQYESMTKKVAVSNSLTKQKIISFVIEKKISTEFEEAEKLADEFLDYAEKRSLYFDNNFTHKTFLEYYTAYYIYINYERKAKINERKDVINKYILNPFWSIVLELLINLIDEEQADNEVIDDLIINTITKSKDSYPFILSILPSLKNISDQLIQEIIAKSIIFCITHGNDNDDKNILDLKIFRQLNQLANYEIFNSHIQKLFVDIYHKQIDEKIKIKAIIFIESLFNVKINNDTINSDMDLLKQKNEFIFLIHSYKNPINYLEYTIEYIEAFGVESFSRDIDGYYLGIIFSPISYYYLEYQIKPSNLLSFPKNIKTLIRKGVNGKTILESLTISSYEKFGHLDLLVLQEAFNNTKDVEIRGILLAFIFYHCSSIQINNFLEGSNIDIKTKVILSKLLSRKSRSSTLVQFINGRLSL